ncbi:MAG: dTMP kinase [SAR86 cluster bacterium]|nr:dTMP kinase [SAR86 cluster bacterium]MBL6810739.1 dTMP kinase [SAR86 cluster bacterium]
MFISFEGIEGSGKSTQIDLIEELIRAKGYQVKKLREPGTTELGEKIRNIFLEKTTEIVDPITEAFLLYASRKHLDQNFLRQNLNDGAIVIADRYADATLAYQSYGKGLDHNFVKLIHDSSQLLSPDLTFYMDISAELSRERISDREMDRMESESIDFFKKVREGYLKIAHDNPERVVVLDANKTIDELHESIKKIISNKLNVSLD